MNDLAARGAVFGKDVIFTFGPLASVYTTFFHPWADLPMLMASGVLALGVFASWSVLLRKRSALACLLVSLTAWFMLSSRDAMMFLVPALAALATCELVWAQRGAEGEVRRGHPWLLVGLAIAWASVGLLPLIKGTVLVLSLALTGLTALYVFIQGRRALALAVLVLPQLVTIVVWQQAGQSVADLPWYLLSMSEIIKGYTDAMSSWHVKRGHFTQVVPFVLFAMFLLRLVWRQGQQRDWLTAFFYIAVFGLSLFVVFKAAFVRHDEGHAVASASLMSVLVAAALVREPMARGRLLRWVVVTLAYWLIIMTALPNWSMSSHLAGWWSTQRASLIALNNRLTNPEVLTQAYRSALSEIRRSHPLPAVKGTIDVYSTNQAAVLAHELDWQPRPVLQSYSAYTPKLASLNRDHLVGAGAPDWILFAVEPIDGRFAFQEDGASWLKLLAAYDPVQRVPDGLMLKRRADSVAVVAQPGNLLFSQSASLGERVELPQSAELVMMSLEIEPNLLGRVMRTVFKAGPLALEVELVSGEVRRERIVPGMVVEEVLLSPLVESTDEFAFLYGSGAMLMDKRVKSIRLVEVNRGLSQWQEQYQIRLRTQSLASRRSDADMDTMAPRLSKALVSDLPFKEVECEGHIDAINAWKQGDVLLHKASILRAKGWMVAKAASGPVLKTPVLFAQAADGRHWVVPTEEDSRPDVGAHLGHASFSRAGWKIFGDFREIHGALKISMAYEQGGEIHACSNLALSLQRP